MTPINGPYITPLAPTASPVYEGGRSVTGLPTSYTRPAHTLDIGSLFRPNPIAQALFNYAFNESDASNSADAPGYPSESDGFILKKRWNGKKVKKPNGRGKGYPAKDGGIWVPTGPGGALLGTTGSAHGGPHWDVQYSNGKYINVYPGGKKR